MPGTEHGSLSVYFEIWEENESNYVNQFTQNMELFKKTNEVPENVISATGYGPSARASRPPSKKR